MDTRKMRGQTQKLFLIETIESGSETNKIYKIMGSTGNIYTITIGNNPACSCPDFTSRFKRCKHIYFALIKLMKVNDPNKITYSDNELLEMFKNIPQITNELHVSKNIKDKYLQLTDNKDVIKEIEPKCVDDMCPVCLEDVTSEPYIYCKYYCGRCIHATCYEMWSKVNSGKCIFCTKPFNQISNSTEKYINLLL